MKVLVVAAHPDLNKSRVNKRWMEALRSAPVTINSIYQEYPDGNIDVEREQKLLSEHDRIVLQFPFYWYSVPYLLKRWFEEVLAFGWAYGPGGVRLQGKELVVAVSVGGPGESYQAGGYNNYSISELLKPLQATSSLIGANYLPVFKLHGAVIAKEEEIARSADAYLEHILNPELDPKVALRRILSEMEQEGKTL